MQSRFPCSFAQQINVVTTQKNIQSGMGEPVWPVEFYSCRFIKTHSLQKPKQNKAKQTKKNTAINSQTHLKSQRAQISNQRLKRSDRSWRRNNNLSGVSQHKDFYPHSGFFCVYFREQREKVLNLKNKVKRKKRQNNELIAIQFSL